MIGQITVYLAGEIHTSWRDEIMSTCEQRELPITFVSPVCDHPASDDCGEKILGHEDSPFWKDHKAAKINAIRTRLAIQKADIVVVRFGEKYRQWNAAFDAGIASALDKPLITFHSDEHRHALKEIDAAALAVCETSQQVADVLTYVTTQE